MKTFKFYLEIDAVDRDAAQEQLEDQAGGMSFGDLECEVLPCETISADVLKKYFNIKKDSELQSKLEKYFEGWDGWFCTVEDCGHTCGCDTGDMFDHLMTHTIQELKDSQE
jgi:hypothetical protein